MIKYGYVFERDYRIKVLSEDERKDKTIFGLLSKRMKTGGIKQVGGMFLNPINTSPTDLEGLYLMESNRAILYLNGITYLSYGSKFPFESYNKNNRI